MSGGQQQEVAALLERAALLVAALDLDRPDASTSELLTIHNTVFLGRPGAGEAVDDRLRWALGGRHVAPLTRPLLTLPLHPDGAVRPPKLSHS